MKRMLAVIAVLGALAVAPAGAQDPQPGEPKTESKSESVEIIRLPDGEIKIVRTGDGEVIIERNGKRIVPSGDAEDAGDAEKAQQDEDANKRIQEARERVERLRKQFDLDEPFRGMDDIFKRLKERQRDWQELPERPEFDEAMRRMRQRMEEFRRQHEENVKQMRERFERMRRQAEEGDWKEWESPEGNADTEVIEREYTSPDGTTRIKVKIVRSTSSQKSSEKSEDTQDKPAETPKVDPGSSEPREEQF